MKTDFLEEEKSVMLYSEPEQAASRYEALRMSAFGEPVLVEYRRGLVLFLRRGMLSWLRSLTIDTVPQMRPHALPTAIRAPYQKSAVIRIFAALAATQP